MEEKNFLNFIEEVMNSNNFNWFVTLGYIPERHQRPSARQQQWESFLAETDPDCRDGFWTKTPATAEECFQRWLKDAERGPGPEGPGIRDYLWLEEYRRGGTVLFHVLMANWQGFEDAWEQRWRDISGGWARTREMDERINGLLGYFVMRAGCVLRLNCGEFRGRFHATDFRPWKKKSY